MTLNEIQGERMKSYFIESAKNIIRSEGLKVVTVRNVAKSAGYSYATLYNYFSDLRELIFECVKYFLVECKDFINSQKHPSQHGIERIISLTKAFTKYFVQYPGTFDLLFLEKTPEISTQNIHNEIDKFFDSIFKEEWQYCESMKIIKKEKIVLISGIHKHLTYGLLLMYLSRKSTLSYNDFNKQLTSKLEYLLNK
jgi:AcrR family transcriptional regulator